MTTLQIVFVNNNKADDERIIVRRDGSGFSVQFKLQNTTTTQHFQTTADVREYLLNVLNLVVHDDDPCIGVQFFFPGSPTVLYTHSTLKKDEPWDSVLDNLDFWLDQPTWPQLPPISPILAPASVTTEPILDTIDLTEADITIEYNNRLNQRTVKPKADVKPNTHQFFTDDGCPCPYNLRRSCR
jgi:hypothetical protein